MDYIAVRNITTEMHRRKPAMLSLGKRVPSRGSRALLCRLDRFDCRALGKKTLAQESELLQLPEHRTQSRGAVAIISSCAG